MKQKWSHEGIDLTGKTIIITGANSGIGYEATKTFAMLNATIIMACRNQQKAEKAKQDILQFYPNSSLTILPLDLSDFNSIDQFVNKVKENYTSIDILLNNAGIMAVPYQPTAQGYELQFGTNHLGHFRLTLQLLPLIENSEMKRIVVISSLAHIPGRIKPETFLYEQGKKYSKSFAYAQSKLSNLMFAYQLQDKLREQGSLIKVVAAHPGISSTGLGSHISLMNTKLVQLFMKLLNQSQEKGGLPSIRACLDPNIKGKEFFGPSGIFHTKGHAVVHGSTRLSKNESIQKMLWNESEKLTKITL